MFPLKFANIVFWQIFHLNYQLSYSSSLDSISLIRVYEQDVSDQKLYEYKGSNRGTSQKREGSPE